MGIMKGIRYFVSIVGLLFLSVAASFSYYDVLGVTPYSSQAEIKQSYRKLARQYHPDTNDGTSAAKKKFFEIKEAYDVLSDEEKRKQYDHNQRKNVAWDKNNIVSLTDRLLRTILSQDIDSIWVIHIYHPRLHYFGAWMDSLSPRVRLAHANYLELTSYQKDILRIRRTPSLILVHNGSILSHFTPTMFEQFNLQQVLLENLLHTVDYHLYIPTISSLTHLESFMQFKDDKGFRILLFHIVEHSNRTRSWTAFLAASQLRPHIAVANIRANVFTAKFNLRGYSHVLYNPANGRVEKFRYGVSTDTILNAALKLFATTPEMDDLSFGALCQLQSFSNAWESSLSNAQMSTGVVLRGVDAAAPTSGRRMECEVSFVLILPWITHRGKMDYMRNVLQQFFGVCESAYGARAGVERANARCFWYRESERGGEERRIDKEKGERSSFLRMIYGEGMVEGFPLDKGRSRGSGVRVVAIMEGLLVEYLLPVSPPTSDIFHASNLRNWMTLVRKDIFLKGEERGGEDRKERGDSSFASKLSLRQMINMRYAESVSLATNRNATHQRYSKANVNPSMLYNSIRRVWQFEPLVMTAPQKKVPSKPRYGLLGQLSDALDRVFYGFAALIFIPEKYGFFATILCFLLALYVLVYGYSIPPIVIQLKKLVKWLSRAFFLNGTKGAEESGKKTSEKKPEERKSAEKRAEGPRKSGSDSAPKDSSKTDVGKENEKGEEKAPEKRVFSNPNAVKWMTYAKAVDREVPFETSSGGKVMSILFYWTRRGASKEEEDAYSYLWSNFGVSMVSEGRVNVVRTVLSASAENPKERAAKEERERGMKTAEGIMDSTSSSGLLALLILPKKQRFALVTFNDKNKITSEKAEEDYPIWKRAQCNAAASVEGKALSLNEKTSLIAKKAKAMVEAALDGNFENWQNWNTLAEQYKNDPDNVRIKNYHHLFNFVFSPKGIYRPLSS